MPQTVLVHMIKHTTHNAFVEQPHKTQTAYCTSSMLIVLTRDETFSVVVMDTRCSCCPFHTLVEALMMPSNKKNA